MRRACSICVLTIAAALATAAPPPELADVQPPGAQRGTALDVALAGARLADLQEVVLYRPGISAGPISVADGLTRVSLTLAPDCPLGEHPLRVRGPGGLSELRTFWVGPLATVPEVEPNGELAAATPIALNSTCTGVVQAEDVDTFAFDGKAGQRVSAEVEGIRLGRSMFDPHLAILDAARFELAVNDDSDLLRQDSLCSVVLPADGRYYVQIREASFGGGPAAHYRIHVGDFPRPVAVSPPGVIPGSAAQIEWINQSGEAATSTVLVAEPAERAPIWITADAGAAPSPVWVRASALPDLSTAPAARTPPFAFHGRIATAGASELISFTAAAGQTLDCRVIARALRSPLDPVLELLGPDDRALAAADDVGSLDAEFRFTFPADGEYRLRVRDHRARGGSTFVYRVEVEPPQPSLALRLERNDNRRPQFLQALNVPRGNRFAALFRADRKNIDGPVSLDLPGLPAGLRALPAAAAAGDALVPLVLEAAADAAPAAALVAPIARLTHGGGERLAEFRQTAPLVIDAPNETVYYEAAVDRLAVAVSDAAPFRVELDPLPTALLREGRAVLRVRVVRDAGFTAPVQLHMLWNPPGIATVPTVDVPAEAAEAQYPINAAGDAPLRSFPVVVLAHAPVGDGEVWVSSAPIELVVADRYFRGALGMAAATQGQPAQFACKFERVRALESATATVSLLGLPPGAVAAPLTVPVDGGELAIPVTLAADAPVGQHPGIVADISIAYADGNTTVHRLAADGVLRIDAPPPEVAAAPPPPPAPPPDAAAPPPRALSRLEQLRQRAKSPASAPAGGSP